MVYGVCSPCNCRTCASTASWPNSTKGMRRTSCSWPASLATVRTATAAASGFFGKPVYVPVVSETLARARLVDLPVPRAEKAPHKAVTAKPEAGVTEPHPPERGRAAIREFLTRAHAGGFIPAPVELEFVE